MSQNDLPYWLALVSFPLFGAVKIGKLMRAFPDMERAFFATHEELLRAGIEETIAERFVAERTYLDPAAQMAKLEKEQVSAVTRKDPQYPALLQQLYDPPAVLFYRGTLPSSDRKHIAVVGSRKSTSYGIRCVERIIGPLAESGVVIVSGLAYGIDAAAHRITIEKHGTTIAILGSGIDHDSIYPSANRTLASQIIASGGAIISEFPLGSLPLQHHFPMRNRIIAGISHGTLIIEAAQKSGSLITAKAALDAGREVYAIPGAIDEPLSEGPNNLIKMGAIPVTAAGDIMFGLVEKKETIVYEPRNDLERIILQTLSRQPIHIDEIADQTQLPIDQLSSTITLLEMKGVMRHEGGRHYTKNS